VAILALAATLTVCASPSRAAASAPVAFPSAIEEEWEEEPGEWEVEEDEEEWEVEDEGEWEVEEDEEEGERGSGWEVSGEGRHRDAPESCTPYRANASIVALERRDTVRLKVSYTSDKATTVEVEYWLEGSRGALQMKSLQRRMSRQGSLRVVERLSDREMSKVRAARAFVVDLDMAGVPSYRERYCTRHLTTRERRGDRMVWSEPERQTPEY
jgi:hypothetical protein